MALDAKESWAGENILSIEQFGVESAKCVPCYRTSLPHASGFI